MRMMGNISAIIISMIMILGCQDGVSEDKDDDPRWRLVERHILQIPEPSGLAIDIENDRLWTVSDRTGKVYLIAKNGDIIRELTFVGENLEGIAFDPSSNRLYIVEEENGDVVVIDTSGSELDRFHVPGTPRDTNKGIEGICYNGGTQRLYLIAESAPTTLFEASTDGDLTGSLQLDFASDYSGLAFDDSTGNLWIVSDESEALFEVELTGRIVTSFGIDVTKAEGVAIDNDTLYVVSDEEAALYKYVFR